MVRRKSGRKRRTTRKTVTKIVGGKRCVCRTSKGVKGGKGALKKCIVAAIKRTKFTTPKSARRAFAAAAKKCRKILTGVAPRSRRRTGARKARRTTTRRRRSPARMNVGSWSGNVPRRAERMSHSKYWLNQ